VRANPTIGGMAGKAQTNGRLVKPTARRSGATISSALQMVGVSKARRCSNNRTSMVMPGVPLGGLADGRHGKDNGVPESRAGAGTPGRPMVPPGSR
jgi:hypothetical protein